LPHLLQLPVDQDLVAYLHLVLDPLPRLVNVDRTTDIGRPVPVRTETTKMDLKMNPEDQNVNVPALGERVIVVAATSRSGVNIVRTRKRERKKRGMGCCHRKKSLL
jgi:hypothetical protein